MYRSLLICMISLTVNTLAIAADKENDLGYRGQNNDGTTVEETLESLKADSSMSVRMDRGWTIVTTESGQIIWSFTPETHPAHPSYVKREVVERDGRVYIQTGAKCGAEKSACDQLVQDFIDLNKRVQERFN